MNEFNFFGLLIIGVFGLVSFYIVYLIGRFSMDKRKTQKGGKNNEL